ncbi:MAG: CRISPR-associated endonuclease Cas2 [Anaerolineae bacterium]
MHCLVVYDISDDRLRGKVADMCLDYGLDRIQYSAFAGSLARSHVEELALKLKRRIGKKKQDVNIRIYTICERDWQECIELP